MGGGLHQRSDPRPPPGPGGSFPFGFGGFAPPFLRPPPGDQRGGGAGAQLVVVLLLLLVRLMMMMVVVVVVVGRRRRRGGAEVHVPQRAQGGGPLSAAGDEVREEVGEAAAGVEADIGGAFGLVLVFLEVVFLRVALLRGAVRFSAAPLRISAPLLRVFLGALRALRTPVPVGSPTSSSPLHTSPAAPGPIP